MSVMTEISPQARPAHPRLRTRISHALLGAFLLGVIVPCLLTVLQANPAEFGGSGMNHHHVNTTFFSSRSNMLAGLLIFAGVFCGPGALLLAAIIMWELRRAIQAERRTHDFWIRRGCLWGALSAFLNVPGYMAVAFLREDGFSVLRLIALFAVSGATCGAWIGWQAWQEVDLDTPFIPRFSLRMLILLSMGWGGLLWLFLPR